MPCKEINRVPKTLTTKLSTPCTTIRVHWDAFGESDPEPEPNQPERPKTDK